MSDERMNPRWEEVDVLFEAALDEPPDQRREYLEAATDDVDLRAAVLELLRAAGEADRYFESPAEHPAGQVWQDLADEVEADACGDERLGAYRLLRVLGRGGMGTVYLAERADGSYRQRVALKLLRQSVDSSELSERFLSERQILAGLQHPNIARLLDGGEAADGRPFLVMEYVEGTPIDRFCDERRLTIEQRLRLFADVGRAVQYAHRNLVVHRDLKPSNILVLDDGTVKLLDFGIAKLLDRSAEAEAGPQTRTGMWLMTPEYASPEQVCGGPITTASDVYQLGLLLYRLLTGEHPYEVEGGSPGEIERIICETEPPPPGSTLRRQRGEEVARSRRTTFPQLRSLLRGDLETITLVALRKEPDRRYESAGELVHEIERHLRDEPVLARRDSVAYRTSKFVRRNRAQVASAAVVLLLLMAYVFTSGIQSQRMREQRDITQMEAQRAEAAMEFLTSLFVGADPRSTGGEPPTVRELLDRGAARVQTELASEPAARAQLMSVLGETYGTLNLYEQAEPLVEGAASEFVKLFGERDGRAIAARIDLADLRVRQSRYEEAESLMLAVLSDIEAAGSEDPGQLGSATASLAQLRSALRDFEAADTLYERAAALYEEEYGERHPYTATIYSNWAQDLERLRQLDSAAELMRKSLAIKRETLADLHPDIAYTLSRLGRIVQAQGDLETADTLLREALSQQRRIYPGDHSDVSGTLLQLAQLHESRGDMARAEAYARESLAMLERLVPGSHNHAVTLTIVGRILMGAAKYDRAEEMYSKAVEIYESHFGEEYPGKTITLYNLATIYHESGRLERAEALFREVVERDRAAYGDEHVEVGVDLNRLAAVLRDGGQAQQAERVYRESMRILERELRGDHPRIAEVRIGLGGALTALGRPEEAEPLLREGLELREQIYQQESWQVAEAKVRLGTALAELGRADDGGPLLRDGYETMLRVRGPDDRRTRDAQTALGTLH